MTSMSLRVRCTLLFSFLLVAAAPLFAQQTGAIRGKVTTTDGATLPGVTVTARSDVLPQPRETVTAANGEYLLPALQPGTYTVEFALSGMQTVTPQGRRPARAADAARRHARRGHQRDDHGHRRVLDHRQGLRHDRERASPTSRSWACRSGRSTATCRS